MALGRGGRSLSLFEMVIVLILISVLAVVAVEKMLALRVAAERAALERTLVTLRTVLVLELAGRLMRGEGEEDLASVNPMQIWNRHVEYPLPRYRGETGGASALAVAPGDWYFDSGARLLVYRALNEASFHSNGPDPREVRFRVAPRFEDRNGNGVRDAAERLQGVRLEALDSYRWNENSIAEYADS